LLAPREAALLPSAQAVNANSLLARQAFVGAPVAMPERARWDAIGVIAVNLHADPRKADNAVHRFGPAGILQGVVAIRVGCIAGDGAFAMTLGGSDAASDPRLVSVEKVRGRGRVPAHDQYFTRRRV
jgi:hypothetical protein